MTRIRFVLPPILLCLGGCATEQAGRASLNVRHEIVYVDRPVAAVKAADIPVPPCRSRDTPQATLAACLGTRPADARQALDLATARLLELIGYADIADPLLHSAAAPPEPPRR
jgi:hypothetical protein